MSGEMVRPPEHYALMLSFKVTVKQRDGAPWPPTLSLFVHVASAPPHHESRTRSEVCRTESNPPWLVSSAQNVRVFNINYFVACYYDQINWQEDHIDIEAKQLSHVVDGESTHLHGIVDGYVLRASATIAAHGLLLPSNSPAVHVPFELAGGVSNLEKWHVEISVTRIHSNRTTNSRPDLELPNGFRSTASSRVQQMWTVLRAVDCLGNSPVADIDIPEAVNGDADDFPHGESVSAEALLECSSKLLHNIDYRYFSFTACSARHAPDDMPNLLERLSFEENPEILPLALPTNSTPSSQCRFCIQDVLLEIPTCSRTSCQYLRTAIADCNALYDILCQDDGLLQVVPELSALADGMRRLRHQLHAQLEYLIDNADRDLHFKPSRLKTDANLSFLPTNLHLHYTNVLVADKSQPIQRGEKTAESDEKDAQLNQMRLVTVGAFAAHALKFNHGGMLRLLHERPNVTSWLDHCARVVCRMTHAKAEIDKQLANLATHAENRPKGVENDDDDVVGISESPINTFENVKYFVLSQFQYLLSPSSLPPLTYINPDSSNETDLLEILWNLASIRHSSCQPPASKRPSLPSFCSLCMNSTSWDENLCSFLNNTSALHALNVSHDGQNTETTAEELADTARSSAHKLLDTLCVSFALFCSGFHGTTNSRANAVDNAQLVAQYASDLTLRYATVVSQAISTLASGLVTEILAVITLQLAKSDRNYFIKWLCTAHRCGLLLCFESLLSCYGAERGMLEDFAFACEQLKNIVCEIVLVEKTDEKPESFEIKSRLTRDYASGKLLLSIKVPNIFVSPAKTDADDQIYASLCRFDEQIAEKPDFHAVDPVRRSSTSKKIMIHIPVRFHPVLFNVGINETATLAETLGNNELENMLNRKSAASFSEFVQRRSELLGSDRQNSSFSPVEKKHEQLIKLIAELEDECRLASKHSKTRKVAILKLAAQACRTAGGIRFTSCKSAKDRTAMSVTLEQAEWLNAELHAFDDDDGDAARQQRQQHFVSVLRTEGVRLRNVVKNIGSPKYAFSQLQLLTFPEQYRPPAQVCSKNVQT